MKFIVSKNIYDINEDKNQTNNIPGSTSSEMKKLRNNEEIEEDNKQE